jgi:multidrug efflux pump subunit AcrA (membrane-fusion protein)
MVSTIDGTVTAVNVTAGEQLSASGTGGTTLSGSGSGSGRTSSSIGSRTGTGSTAQNSANTTTPQIQVVSTGSFAVSLPVAAGDINSVAVGQPVSLTVSTASTPTVGGFGGAGGFGAFAGAFGGGQRTRAGAAGAGGNGAANTGGGGTGGAGTGARQGAGTGGQGGQGAAANVGATATGKVSDVSKVADTSTGVGTYAVTVDFTADPSQFLIGATVSANITTAQRNNVVLVPILAVTTTGTGSTVTVATGGSADGPTEVRNVTLGVRSGANVEVTNGLKVGDQVVVEVPAALANRLGGGTGTGTGAGTTGTGTGTGGNRGQAPTGASGATRRGRTGTSGPSGGNGSTP